MMIFKLDHCFYLSVLAVCERRGFFSLTHFYQYGFMDS